MASNDKLISKINELIRVTRQCSGTSAMDDVSAKLSQLVTLMSQELLKKDTEEVCLSDDGGVTVVKGWEVFDTTVTPPTSKLYFGGVDVTATHQVVQCISNSVDSTFTYENIYYRTLTSNEDHDAGDILLRKIQIDESTMTPTGNELWRNVDKNTILAGYTPVYGADIEALDQKRIKLSSEELLVTNSLKSLASVPPTANLAEIHVLDAGVVFTLDGATLPVGNGGSPKGIRQQDGAIFELESSDEINNFNVVRLSGSNNARLYIEYYQVYDLNNG